MLSGAIGQRTIRSVRWKTQRQARLLTGTALCSLASGELAAPVERGGYSVCSSLVIAVDTRECVNHWQGEGGDMISTIPMYPDLAGKVAVITGSSRGIGAATCRMLAANGTNVMVNGRDEAAVRTTVENIRAAGGEATGVTADTTELAALERLRDETERTYGPADLLGAFVAGGGPLPGPTPQIAESEWDDALRGNLTATFLAVKTFLPGMVERGRGAIVTMASTAARHAGGHPIGAPTGYSVAKAGVVRLTQEVAREVARHGVRINCVSPSTIVTERTAQVLSAERRAQLTAMHPLGRLGTPEDVASAVLFLASSCSSWITGVTLDVAGGQIMI